MSTQPISDRSGLSLAGKNQTAEVKAALTNFVSDVRQNTAELKTQLIDQERRLQMMETKTVHSARPALSTRQEPDLSHKSAFSAYLRSGDDEPMRGLELEGKALSTAVAADGGYLIDPQTSESIATVLKSSSSIRSIAKVVSVESGSYEVLVDHTEIGSGWADEATASAETSTPTLDKISIPLYELSAMPKASQRLLDDAAFDVEAWLAERIADKFARAEGGAFVTGDGADKPKGFLTYPAVENGSWDWGNLGYVATGANGDFDSTDPADAIVDLVYALGARYRANATFVMNSKTAGAVRKMKDADGRFLWSDGLAAGEPSRLMGYPVLIAEDMPDIDADAYAIAFGDFSAGYTIAERPDLRILRDPFSVKPNVLFYATKRVGGDVSDFAAIKLLKFAAS